MLSDSHMISWIRAHIARNGKLTNTAKSCWGMDRWELNGIEVGLGDDGYTDYIYWGDRLRCYHTHTQKTTYNFGTYDDLFILYKGLGGEV